MNNHSESEPPFHTSSNHPLSICPHCKAKVHAKRLSKHISQKCPRAQNLLQTSQTPATSPSPASASAKTNKCPDCFQLLKNSSLKKHQKNCMHYKLNKNLYPAAGASEKPKRARKSANSKAEKMTIKYQRPSQVSGLKICSYCSTPVSRSEYQHHLQEKCPIKSRHQNRNSTPASKTHSKASEAPQKNAASNKLKPVWGQPNQGIIRPEYSSCEYCNYKFQNLEKHQQTCSMKGRTQTPEDQQEIWVTQQQLFKTPEKRKKRTPVSRQRKTHWEKPHDPESYLDGSRGYGYTSRERGRFGSHPSFDDYNDESMP